MIWNKDDSGEDALASKRFELYNQHIPVSDNTRDILAFLKGLHSGPPHSSAERRQVLARARELAGCEVEAPARLSTESLEQLIEDVREMEMQSTQPPPETRSLVEGVSAR